MDKKIKRVILTVPEGISSDWEIVATVMDALAEFVGSRVNGDAEAYVIARYPNYTESDDPKSPFARKVAEVRRRLDIARALRHNIEIDAEPGLCAPAASAAGPCVDRGVVEHGRLHKIERERLGGFCRV
jgi:hypothetical protein